MHLELLTHHPAADPRPTPLLFVPGAWHGAWRWAEHFLPYFAEHGYMSHALSLRGHGGSEGDVRGRRIAHYVEDVAQAVGGLPSPPVLIGHAMGGLVVQKYLETHSVPAAVLLASVPTHGVTPATLRVAPRHPLAFLEANLTMSLYPIVGSLKLCREALFSKSIAHKELRTYFGKIQDESYLAYLDMLIFALPRPKRVAAPILVLGAANDTLFAPGEVQATARAYHTTAHIFPGLAHDMMLEPGWQAVADRILAWLNERGL